LSILCCLHGKACNLHCSALHNMLQAQPGSHAAARHTVFPAFINNSHLPAAVLCGQIHLVYAAPALYAQAQPWSVAAARCGAQPHTRCSRNCCVTPASHTPGLFPRIPCTLAGTTWASCCCRAPTCRATPRKPSPTSSEHIAVTST
jgi:hypothetical protein